MTARCRPRATGALACLALVWGAIVAVAPAQELALPVAAQEPYQLTARGTPEEIGTAVGDAYGDLIGEFHQTFLATAIYLSRQNRNALYQRARQLAEHLHPDDVAMLRGLAAASELPYDDVLFLNVFYELTTQPLACRQLAVWGDATPDGELLHGRNLDWPDYPGSPLQQHHLVLHVRPADEEQIDYVALTWPGLMATITGSNRAGITLGFNQLPIAAAAPEASEPIFFTLQRVLRTCRTLDEAVALVTEARPVGNGTILISDAQRRDARVIEVVNGEVGVRQAGGMMLGNANHATREAGLEGLRFYGPADWPTCHVAMQLGGPIDVAAMQRVLRHPQVIQRINLLAAVFAPSRNRLYLATGTPPAAQRPYLELPLFEPDPNLALDADEPERAPAAAPAQPPKNSRSP